MKNFTQIPNNLIRSGKTLSHSEFRVLITILSFKPSYPSYSALSEMTGMSSATISKSIEGLVSKNILKYTKGCNLTHRNNQYELQDESDWLLTPTSEIKVEGTLESKEALLQNLKSNNTNNNNITAAEDFNFQSTPTDTIPEKKVIKVNPEHKEILDQANQVPKELLTENDCQFLKGKESNLTKFGSFNPKQLKWLQDIIAKNESHKPNLKRELLTVILTHSNSGESVIKELKQYRLNPDRLIALFDLILDFNGENKYKYSDLDLLMISNFLNIELDASRMQEVNKAKVSKNAPKAS